MGKGKDLFGHYNDLAKEKGPGTAECTYASVLFQALLMLGERKVFEMLEEAEQTGKHLALDYSENRDGVPRGVVLV
ncbi:hypothetical protein [Dyadobacter sandarakinus]|uniref:Uncharacterized protein n=1 Tax=Dyadobacter sandarakinus TaxID=2747268 RepID=A0ABX7I2R0_9BACT|nr:hypothetical protein [Dyadobacter sandarakinus]QRQ99522.1 hypothetical protein HWI92_00635 [Dyadobacter sandarakinus]